MDPDQLVPVCILAESHRLAERSGLRFRVRVHGLECDAFAIRFRGRMYAYLNTCRHELLPLDFGDAHFFDERGDALVCCHHGARYRPETGLCVEGPCRGSFLTRLELEVRDGALWCVAVAARPLPRPGH
jgi:nitrite reductase/ring-hydroxylating ferredoxin subunit